MYPCTHPSCQARFDAKLVGLSDGESGTLTGWVYPWDAEVEGDIPDWHDHAKGEPIEVDDEIANDYRTDEKPHRARRTRAEIDTEQMIARERIQYDGATRHDIQGVDRQTYERPVCGSLLPHDPHMYRPTRQGLKLNCCGYSGQSDDPEIGTVHISLRTHDGYAPHSHEVRSDHMGVAREEYHEVPGMRHLLSECSLALCGQGPFSGEPVAEAVARQEKFAQGMKGLYAGWRGMRPRGAVKAEGSSVQSARDAELGVTAEDYLHDILLNTDEIVRLLERIANKLEEG